MTFGRGADLDGHNAVVLDDMATKPAAGTRHRQRRSATGEPILKLEAVRSVLVFGPVTVTMATGRTPSATNPHCDSPSEGRSR
jgi:hypothetical protein